MDQETVARTVREAVAGAGSGGEVGSAPRLFGGGLQGLRLPPRDQKRPPLVKASSPETFRREHAFWTYQQVMDKYGRPDEMSRGAEGTIYWAYREEGTELHLSFTFFEGVVIDAGSN